MPPNHPHPGKTSGKARGEALGALVTARVSPKGDPRTEHFLFPAEQPLPGILEETFYNDARLDPFPRTPRSQAGTQPRNPFPKKPPADKETLMPPSRGTVLQKVAREAGACLRHFFRKDLHIRKKSELDLVTLADETAEKLVLNGIREFYPEDAVIAEESGNHKGSSHFQWIIDPLDGTTNFAHGFPHFAVSIALLEEGRVIEGVVYDPVKEEYFHGRLGHGASLNGAPIRVGGCQTLADALAVTGFSYDRRQRLPELLDRVRRMLSHCRGFRRLGSAALDLAYVACGRFDLYLEDGLHPWDIAAGRLLVTEAGGYIADFSGGPLDPFACEVVAANLHLKDQLFRELLLPKS